MKKFISLFLLISFVWLGYSFLTLGNTKISSQDFTISKGDTFSTLPSKLGIDISSTFYKVWIKFYHAGFILQAGNYHVGDDVTLNNLFDKVLSSPQTKDLTITILSGWNIYDIDEYLSNTGIISRGKLIKEATDNFFVYQKKYPFLASAKSLEGFLYPDTYRIRPGSTVSDVINVLLSGFQNQIINKENIKSDELYPSLILASIVEREEKNSTNKRIVAGILAKRLREGIALGADATVCYPFKLTQKECTSTFIGDHVYEKSDYNTRKILGLPPTPISNVSADTFDATIHSQSSPYYYYLHDNLGEIHYSEDLAGHNANRVKYLGK